MCRCLSTVIACGLLTSSSLWNSARAFSRVCYFTGSGVRGKEDLSANMIDTGACTHIIRGFFSVSSDDTFNLDGIGGHQGISEFAALKLRNPELKLLLAVGGGGTNNTDFKHMLSSPERVERFVSHIVRVLRKNRMDGLDVDWEFPDILDSGNLSKFLKSLFQAFKNTSNKELPLLLSVAVPAPRTLVVGVYDVAAMAQHVDFVNLMTYDLNTYHWYTPFTGFNSPLFKRCTDIGYFATLNVKSSAEYWVSKGMPKSKVMVGIPTYGLSWTLLNPAANGVGSLAVGRGEEGGGFVSLPKTCQMLREGALRKFDEEAMVPSLQQGHLWVSYDDQVSVALKATWSLENNYGGVMSFSLNSDDTKGECGNGTFPLHRSILGATSGGRKR